MPSLIKILAEEQRQRTANDAKFYRNFLYYFELTIPSGAVEGLIEGSTKTFLFPLILNPQGISMSDPFTVQTTPTTRGGLFVEENGILERMLTIRGHTGFKPRPNYSSPLMDAVSIDRPSFNQRGTWSPLALSGQRHFHFLQDRVFRVYGDLKRNPAFARDTSMVFHNPKDDEHWLVAPKNFALERDSSRPTLYNYTIELIVVDSARAVAGVDFSEDKPILDQIKDTVRTVQSAIDSTIAVMNDVTSLVNDYRLVTASIFNTLDRAGNFIASARNFVNGTAAAIQQPFKEVNSIVEQVERELQLLADSSIAAKDTVLNTHRQLVDAFLTFGVHPEAYISPAQKRLQQQRRQQELSTSTTKAQLDAAAANPPRSVRELAQRGTALQPGDQARAQAERGVGRSERVYSSAVVRVVSQGDSLPALAARYLGDARQWRKIAELNGLRPPFISPQATPFTKRVGDKILIPSPLPPPEARASTTIFGVPPSADPEVRAFGTDLLFETDSNGFIDFAIDVEGGSVDFKQVSGIANLSQAIVTRVTTEQGTDVLYRRLGYKSLVGERIPGIDENAAEFRLAEAVAADPRVVAVKGVRVATVTQPDAIDVEIDAAVRSFSEQVTVQTRLPTV